MRCSDVRDRVYVLLALINEKEREKLGNRPNYVGAVHFTPEVTTLQSRRISDYVETLRLVLGLSLATTLFEPSNRLPKRFASSRHEDSTNITTSNPQSSHYKHRHTHCGTDSPHLEPKR
jgi:hypothetical protein